MTRRRSHAPLPSPEDVLAGRVRVRADQLFELIHEVNPTGEESPRERERYVLKSRLQALLLTQLGDEVEVHPDAENPDLVSLRHRSGLRDACHALVSQLPVEARALVRRRLDEAVAPGSHLPGTAETPARKSRSADSPPAALADADDAGAPPGALLARGRDAIEAYDYEEARRLLTRAVERGAGAPAARALLELLVDVLADDEDALSLEARLSSSETSDPGVRGFLALAAARSGATDRARRLVRSLDGPLAASVHATLARHALDLADLSRAAEHLGDAKRADPAEPSLGSLEDDLAHRRQAERQPAEEALLSLHSAGDRDAAEAAARELLRRWPDSPAGRRVLRENEEARRHERALALEGEGLAALHAGDPARAVRLLAQALSDGPGSPGVKEVLAHARQELESRTADAAVRGVVDALSPDLPGALSAYAELPVALRSRVREAAPEPLLDLLDEILAANPGEKPRAAADATLALKGAEKALLADEPTAAVGILESHHKALARVARASALSKAAEERLASIRAARARAALSHARALLDTDDLDGAGTALHDLKRGDLDPEGLVELALLKDALHRRESARRARRDAQAREEARHALRLAISTEPHPADELADADGFAAFERFRPCLAPDGRQLVLASAYDQWLFVRVVDVARNEVVRRLSLKVPHALGGFETTLVEDRRLTVLGERTGFVEIDLETGEVLRSGSLTDALPASSVVEHTMLVPGSRLAWVDVTTGPERAPVSFTFDIDSGRARTKHTAGASPKVVPLGPSSFVILEEDRRIRILNVDGLPAAGVTPVLPIDVHTAAPAPAGPGILVVGPSPGRIVPDDEAGIDDPLFVLEIIPGVTSETGREVELPGTWGEAHTGLATARREETSFVLNLASGATRVFTFGPDLVALAPPVTAPAETAFFSDAASNHAVAACWWGERFAAVPLGRETRWPDWGDSLADRDPLRSGRLLDDDYRCRTTSRASNAAALALYASLVDVPPSALPARVDEILRNAPGGDELEALLGALARLGLSFALERRVELQLLQRFPGHRYAVTHAIRNAASEGRWDFVLQAVRRPAPGATASLPLHLEHLHAVALARAGENEAALALLEEVRARDDAEGCEVVELIALLREVVAEKPSETPVGRLVGAVKASIAASAAGDARRVIDLLDRGLLWATEILQGHALLAKAWLDADAGTPRDLFRKRRALARLLDLLGKNVLWRRDLPPLPGSLTESDLGEIAARARAFLDQQVPDAAGPVPGREGPDR